jgi:hypothetical protein
LSGPPPAAVRWHGRLELETPTLTLAEAQFALGASAMLGDERPEAVDRVAGASAAGATDASAKDGLAGVRQVRV